jgi:NADH dehydrogenase (ubiquinone) 1 alpha/beta subcomplex 1
MFRTALLRSARGAAAQVARRSGAIVRPVAPSSFVAKSQFAPSAFQAARCYSAAAGLQKPEIEGRIVDLLKNFDKARSPCRDGALTANPLQVVDVSKVR